MARLYKYFINMLVQPYNRSTCPQTQEACSEMTNDEALMTNGTQTEHQGAFEKEPRIDANRRE